LFFFLKFFICWFNSFPPPPPQVEYGQGSICQTSAAIPGSLSSLKKLDLHSWVPLNFTKAIALRQNIPVQQTSSRHLLPLKGLARS